MEKAVEDFKKVGFTISFESNDIDAYALVREYKTWANKHIIEIKKLTFGDSIPSENEIFEELRSLLRDDIRLLDESESIFAHSVFEDQLSTDHIFQEQGDSGVGLEYLLRLQSAFGIKLSKAFLPLENQVIEFYFDFLRLLDPPQSDLLGDNDQYFRIAVSMALTEHVVGRKINWQSWKGF